MDECFCDLTGLRRPLRMSYETMAARIKADLEHDLGLTFSLGLAPTKVVAKLASKWRKPAGLTVIRGPDLHLYLEKVPIGDVWGIGEQTTAYLTRFGIATALDFARQDELWVRSKLTKPHQDIWHELRGTAVLPLELGEHHAYQSISKTKTFTPPTSDREMLLAQLSKNVENACNALQRITGEFRQYSHQVMHIFGPMGKKVVMGVDRSGIHRARKLASTLEHYKDKFELHFSDSPGFRGKILDH